jgi:hypothetical protein
MYMGEKLGNGTEGVRREVARGAMHLATFEVVPLLSRIHNAYESQARAKCQPHRVILKKSLLEKVMPRQRQPSP